MSTTENMTSIVEQQERPVMEHHATGTYSSDLFADAAIDFITRHQSQAAHGSAIYLSMHLIHPIRKNKLPGQINQWQAPRRSIRQIWHVRERSRPQTTLHGRL